MMAGICELVRARRMPTPSQARHDLQPFARTDPDHGDRDARGRLSCTRARRQMIEGILTARPTVH